MPIRAAILVTILSVASGCCTVEKLNEPWDTHILYWYLAYMGPKLQCQFTQENLNPTNINDWPWNKEIDGDPAINTIDKLVDHLRLQCKGVSVFRDVDHPNVVHLVETALLRRPDYVMERKVDVLFSGRLFDLPDNIGQRLGGNIESPRTFIAGGNQPDVETKVNIRSKGRTVRQVLTDAVPRCYGTFLWYAQTNIEGSNTVTDVKFGSW